MQNSLKELLGIINIIQKRKFQASQILSKGIPIQYITLTIIIVSTIHKLHYGLHMYARDA